MHRLQLHLGRAQLSKCTDREQPIGDAVTAEGDRRVEKAADIEGVNVDQRRLL